MSVTSAPPEERVVLRQVRWDTYERLLADHADARAPRFTYDRGTLEIARPGSRHESLAILVSYLVAAVAEARDLDATSLGSTTFKDPGWERGFEPDACFYLRDAATVRGLERIDPRVDPPPEIVFEVDITRSSIDKLALYAQFGVAEVWAPRRRGRNDPRARRRAPRGLRAHRRQPRAPRPGRGHADPAAGRRPAHPAAALALPGP